MHRLSHLNGGDEAIGVSSPDEGVIGIGFGEGAIDGGLQFDDRSEDAPLEPPSGQPREQSLDRIEPGARFGGEVKDEARMPR